VSREKAHSLIPVSKVEHSCKCKRSIINDMKPITKKDGGKGKILKVS